ncbi:hypothetical protein LINPERHAP2_LOCUS28617 [Linum perenne]
MVDEAGWFLENEAYFWFVEWENGRHPLEWNEFSRAISFRFGCSTPKPIAATHVVESDGFCSSNYSLAVEPIGVDNVASELPIISELLSISSCSLFTDSGLRREGSTPILGVVFSSGDFCFSHGGECVLDLWGRGVKKWKFPRVCKLDSNPNSYCTSMDPQAHGLLHCNQQYKELELAHQVFYKSRQSAPVEFVFYGHIAQSPSYWQGDVLVCWVLFHFSNSLKFDFDFRMKIEVRGRNVKKWKLSFDCGIGISYDNYNYVESQGHRKSLCLIEPYKMWEISYQVLSNMQKRLCKREVHEYAGVKLTCLMLVALYNLYNSRQFASSQEVKISTHDEDARVVNTFTTEEKESNLVVAWPILSHLSSSHLFKPCRFLLESLLVDHRRRSQVLFEHMDVAITRNTLGEMVGQLSNFFTSLIQLMEVFGFQPFATGLDMSVWVFYGSQTYRWRPLMNIYYLECWFGEACHCYFVDLVSSGLYELNCLEFKGPYMEFIVQIHASRSTKNDIANHFQDLRTSLFSSWGEKGKRRTSMFCSQIHDCCYSIERIAKLDGVAKGENVPMKMLKELYWGVLKCSVELEIGWANYKTTNVGCLTEATNTAYSLDTDVCLALWKTETAATNKIYVLVGYESPSAMKIESNQIFNSDAPNDVQTVVEGRNTWISRSLCAHWVQVGLELINWNIRNYHLKLIKHVVPATLEALQLSIVLFLGLQLIDWGLALCALLIMLTFLFALTYMRVVSRELLTNGATRGCSNFVYLAKKHHETRNFDDLLKHMGSFRTPHEKDVEALSYRLLIRGMRTSLI